MIKATELRIGNYVMDIVSKEPMIVDELGKTVGAVIVDESKYPLPAGWQMGYIPITEEWLLKFGLENEFDNYYSNKSLVKESGYQIFPFALFYHNNESYHTSDALHRSSIKPMKYVHELQNLYLPHTGKELTIKELANGN